MKGLTRKEYRPIKALFDDGMSLSAVDAMYGYSRGTLGRIQKSKDYEDYVETARQYIREYWKKRRATEQGAQYSEPEPKNADYNEILRLLKEINEQLKLVPKRRKW